MLQDENHYQEVRGKIFMSLQLVQDYEESFKIYEDSLPDPDCARKEAKHKNSREALAKQVELEKEQQKQEANGAAKIEEGQEGAETPGGKEGKCLQECSWQIPKCQEVCRRPDWVC